MLLFYRVLLQHKTDVQTVAAEICRLPATATRKAAARKTLEALVAACHFGGGAALAPERGRGA